MKIKKLHLLEDSIYSNWYVDNCNLFKDNSTEHVFVCLKANLDYIENKNVSPCSLNGDLYQKLIAECENGIYSTVFIHFMDVKKAEFVNKIGNPKIKFVWVVWGGDLYALNKFNFNIYDRFSKKFMYNHEFLKRKTLRLRAGEIKKKIVSNSRIDADWQSPIYKTIKRLNACATLISKEVDLIRKKCNVTLEQIPFAMVSSHNDVRLVIKEKKNKILVGNSADPATNQFEILKSFFKQQIVDEIIVPLSYGNADYRNELIKEIKLLKLNTTILTEMLPKSEYYKMLSEVRIAIFPHKIQKAFGNIIALLYFGAKVFLRECNPIYFELNKIGVVVFPINSSLAKKDFESLSLEVANKNRKLINEWIGEEKVKGYYNKFLSY